MYLKTLLLAAIVTTCWANSNIFQNATGHIALHRLRRSLITVPGASMDNYATSSQPCSGEGFYSDPSDCTKFYRCIDVPRNNEYLRATFNCPTGTLFSSEYNTCISGTCTKGSASNKYKNLQCSSEGRFSDPNNCGQFYECVPNQNGGFVAHQRSCFGHAFHPTLRACVKPQMVEGCSPASTRSFTVKNPKLMHLCRDKSHQFNCVDCKTMVQCIDGIPYTKPCEEGSVCSIKRSFDGGVCFPSDHAEQCKCKTPGAFQKDDYDPSKFLSCGKEGTDPTISKCAEGLVFDEEKKRCNSEIELKAKCTKPGTFVFKDDCTKYFFCTSTIGGWVRETLTCDDYKMFNEGTGQCEVPCKWYSSSFTCDSEGRFANPADCTKYYECFTDPSDPNKFNSVEYECPEDFKWSQIKNNNGGNCVATGNAKCKCKIPEEWCGDCPEADGFFRSEDKKQCFKLFTDQQLTFADAQGKCMDEKLKFAEPAGDITVALRKKIIAKHGELDASAWLGGQGDGLSIKWKNNPDIQILSTLYKTGHPGTSVSTSHCLELLVDTKDKTTVPTQPLAVKSCTEKQFTLCERDAGSK